MCVECVECVVWRFNSKTKLFLVMLCMYRQFFFDFGQGAKFEIWHTGESVRDVSSARGTRWVPPPTLVGRAVQRCGICHDYRKCGQGIATASPLCRPRLRCTYAVQSRYFARICICKSILGYAPCAVTDPTLLSVASRTPCPAPLCRV